MIQDGSGSSQGETITFSGRLGSANNTNRLFSSQAVDTGNVDQLIAFPVDSPFVFGEHVAREATVSDISADGSFNVSINTDTDYIFTLADSSAIKKDRIVSFVALGDSTDNLIKIPNACHYQY